MTFFDLRTAFLIVGLLYVLLPIVTWFVLARQRSQAVALWCGGGLLLASSSILTGLSATVPHWVSIDFVYFVSLLSSFLRIQSLRLDLRCPWSWHWITAALLMLCLILTGIHWGLQNAALRAQYASISIACLLLYLTVLAWRIGQTEQSPSAHSIAWVYGLVAVAFFMRAYEVTSPSGDAVMVSQLTYSATLLTMTLLLSGVIGHFGYVGLALDRSMRRELNAAAEKAREEEGHRLGSQIAQLDRQRSLGEMSASLGHELNQPLTAILSNAQVAKRGLKLERFEPAQLNDFLDKIIANTQRASQIIERIRDYIRPAALRREPVDLLQIVNEVAALVADLARSHKVTLTMPPSTAMLWVTADAIQISQIILNVLRNAIEALEQAARREIHLSLRREGDRAILTIRDYGLGLTPHVLARIGTPFFTSKADGMGMGLSISRSIARQHGGTLKLDNADGGGALVTLELHAIPEASP